MFLQETYEVEDCIDYQALTSNTHQSEWDIQSGTTISYSDGGMRLSANAWKDLILNHLINKPVSIEWVTTDYTGNNTNPPILFYSYNSSKTRLLYCAGYSTFMFGEYPNGNTFPYTPPKPSSFKIEIDSTECRLYINNTLKSTVSYNMSSPYYLGFSIGENRSHTLNDLKIKPL